MKEITTKELALKLTNKKNVSVIDVREDNEVAEGIIPNAKHIPLGQLSERMDEIDKNQAHYMVCRSGGRSGKACDFLTEHGFDVINMVGGMLAWEDDIKK